jgi:peptidoglycan-associated lipoprotein
MMRLHSLITLALMAGLGLAACDQEAGWKVDRQGQFGNATMDNSLMMSGDESYTMALAQRFSQEVPNTVNFEFNRSDLTPEARAILAKQAQWIRQFPEVRFKVFGFTDNVGSEKFNYGLGMRRAKTVVAYLHSLGIGSARLEAVVSFGKTRPLIDVPGPEVRNRRALTEVTGFVKSDPMVLNGKYAAIIMREYIDSATRPTTPPTITQTQLGSATAGN